MFGLRVWVFVGFVVGNVLMSLGFLVWVCGLLLRVSFALEKMAAYGLLLSDVVDFLCVFSRFM